MYTHEHTDHIMGFDDLRLFQFYLGHGVPVYCEPHVERHLKQTFAYAFTDIAQTPPGAVPSIDFHEIQAGETIELACRHLKNQNIGQLIIANRSIERASELAARHQAQAIGLHELSEYLSAADLLFSSTASMLPIIGKGAVDEI